jgi:Putative Ig domain
MQRELRTALLCLTSIAGVFSSADGSAQTAGNRPPTISGSPPTVAIVGESYNFVPTARDPEGRTLTFTIQRKPRWATLNSRTGRLYGTPAAGNVGSYENIVIAVSDGRSTAALPAFTLNVTARSNGSATVTWAPPTQNTDGSTLTNLAGYRIYYGRSADTLDRTLVLNSPGLTRHTIAGLSSARWYFSMTSIDGNGNESRRSATVSKNVS